MRGGSADAMVRPQDGLVKVGARDVQDRPLSEEQHYQALEARVRQLEDELQGARRSEAAALERLAQYRILAENLTDIVWTLDADLVPTFVTPSVKTHLGYTVQEVAGRAFPDWLTPSSREQQIGRAHV